LTDVVEIAASDTAGTLSSDGTFAQYSSSGKIQTTFSLAVAASVGGLGNWAVLSKSGIPVGAGSLPQNPLVAISAGSSHILGLQKDGTVVSFGDFVPADLTNIAAIATDSYWFDDLNVALRNDGTVRVWAI
jgi:hypothetical protein